MKLLLVEDEDALATWLVRALTQSRFAVTRAADGLEADAFLAAGEYDAVVLDLRLPRKDGFAVLTDMRARDDRTPVLILTAHGDLDDRVRGLNCGADDFLSKPFALAELEARLVALIRRSRGRAFPRLAVGPLAFDAASRAFMLHGEPLSLTPREHAALAALVQHSGQTMPKRQLFDKIFELDSDAQPDAVDVVLHRLRKKLAGSGVQIVTVRGIGYGLEVDAGAAVSLDPGLGRIPGWVWRHPCRYACRSGRPRGQPIGAGELVVSALPEWPSRLSARLRRRPASGIDSREASPEPAGLSSRVRSAAALVSLKGALLLLLLPGLVIVLGMDIFISHNTLRRATDEAYDRALMGSVRAIEQGVGVENEQVRVNVPYVALEMFESTAHSSVYYTVQLLTPGQAPELLTGYDDLPQPPPGLSPDEPHFYDALYRDDWVRVAVLRKPLYRPGLSQQVLIQVAETTETRQALREAIWHNTFWRDLGVTVSAAALLWLAVAWALRPLARLHSEVASRRPDDLAPLDPRHVPREVRPLVEAINHHVRQHGAIADAQTRFLADAAHQLRTPLAVLLIQAEYALREPDPAKVRDSLQAVIEQLHRANRLTSQLLALGRAQHVERSEPTEAFDLAECARQVMIDALPLARERQQDLGWDDDATAAALIVHGNPAFIREALANLVHNAVAHTPCGGEITVGAHRAAARSEVAASTGPGDSTRCDWALVTIDDNGPGIAEEQRARLFQRFERGQSTTSGGSGLGLAIAREYAARYAGTVALDNRPTGGTRASLRLPIA